MTIWKISQLDRNTANGFITTAHWNCSAVDGEFSASVYSACYFPVENPTTPYAQVTEAQVLSWIWANGVDKSATEAAVAAQIEAKKNPVKATGLPWSN